MNTQSYDIIGDIHGQYDKLKARLHKLGYAPEGTTWKHHEGRQVIFLGDYIDPGPRIREVLQTVRGMCDAGDALAIMGNHEYNVIGKRFAQRNSHPAPRFGSANLKLSCSNVDVLPRQSCEISQALSSVETERNDGTPLSVGYRHNLLEFGQRERTASSLLAISERLHVFRDVLSNEVVPPRRLKEYSQRLHAIVCRGSRNAPGLDIAIAGNVLRIDLPHGLVSHFAQELEEMLGAMLVGEVRAWGDDSLSLGKPVGEVDSAVRFRPKPPLYFMRLTALSEPEVTTK